MKLQMISIALASLVMASPANAAPVLLNCTVATQNDGPISMDVQLNEEGGTASYSFAHIDRSFAVRAIFAPDRVAFGKFSISRTDLSIQRINDGQFDQSVFKLAPVDHGKCMVDSRKRAF